MQKIKFVIVGALLVAVVISLIGFINNGKTASSSFFDKLMFANKSRIEIREAKAHQLNKSINIGIAGPKQMIEEHTLFFQGIEMAVEEVNSSGGVLGMTVQTIIEDDLNNLGKSLEIVQNFALNTDVMAVIGHWSSDHTIPAAQLYNQTGVILLAPTATNPLLTQEGYNTVFQNTMNDIGIGKKMAEYAKRIGYKNIAIYYSDTLNGKELSKAFEENAKTNEINIIDRHSSFVNKDEFDLTYKEWKNEDLDAVFIADDMTDAKEVITWLREKNENIPVLAGNGFDFEDMIQSYGKFSENIAYASFQTGRGKNGMYREFENRFLKKYGVTPDFYAAKGYESIQILCDAVKIAQSTSPSELVKALKAEKGLEGINGSIRFDSNGALTTGTIVIKKVINGEIVNLTE